VTPREIPSTVRATCTPRHALCPSYSIAAASERASCGLYLWRYALVDEFPFGRSLHIGGHRLDEVREVVVLGQGECPLRLVLVTGKKLHWHGRLPVRYLLYTHTGCI
jgi:hypothetical protein